MLGSGTYESALRAPGGQVRSPSRSFGSSYGTHVQGSEPNFQQNIRQVDESPGVKLSDVVRTITEEVVECVTGNVTASHVTDEAALTARGLTLYLSQWTTEEKLSQDEFVNDLSDKVVQASTMFMNANITQGKRSCFIDYVMAGEMSNFIMDEAFFQVREGLVKDMNDVQDNLQELELVNELESVMSHMESLSSIENKRMAVLQHVVMPYSMEMSRVNQGYCEKLAQYKEQKQLQQVKTEGNEQGSISDEETGEVEKLIIPEWKMVERYGILVRSVWTLQASVQNLRGGSSRGRIDETGTGQLCRKSCCWGRRG